MHIIVFSNLYMTFFSILLPWPQLLQVWLYAIFMVVELKLDPYWMKGKLSNTHLLNALWKHLQWCYLLSCSVLGVSKVEWAPACVQVAQPNPWLPCTYPGSLNFSCFTLLTYNFQSCAVASIADEVALAANGGFSSVSNNGFFSLAEELAVANSTLMVCIMTFGNCSWC